MPHFSGHDTRTLIGLLSVLSASSSCSLADTPAAQPLLTIGMVLETSSPITLSPLGWASTPVVVDVRTQTVYVRSGGCEFAASVVCANEPVLAVEILSQSGHTNEIEWTSDLVNWTPSNVRWISDGSPVRYYIPQPVGSRLYRVRHSNTSPKAVLTVSPLAVLPGVTNAVVISANSFDAEVVLDASQSSDAENDQLQFAWTEGTNVFATTVKTTKRVELGHHTITLKVGDGLATASASAQLETLTASTAVEVLIAQVRLVEVNLGPRDVRSLLATLEAASASLARGNVNSGVNQLQAFQNQVWAQLVSFNQGNTNLIQAAEGIIRAMTISGAVVSPGLEQAGRL